jgi:purine-nucleoside phosphorylase
MLIISPKTHSKSVKQFVDFFNAKKSDVSFWHSNFKDYHFIGNVGDETVHLLFCGYGEGTMYHAIVHAYEKFLRKEDKNPGIIYVGACFVSLLSDTNLGDIVVPMLSHSDSEIVKEIQIKSGNTSEEFDNELVKSILSSATELSIPARTGNIFCKETYDPDFWFPFAKDWGSKQNYVAGEVESAACIAASHLINVPCVALLDVKDKVNSDGEYVIAIDEVRGKAFENMLRLIEKTIKNK